MIIADGNFGTVAPPDVVTTDLEAYTKGVLKSREKDWDVMGARRVADLWSGNVAEHGRRPDKGLLRQRAASGDFTNQDAEDSVGAKGAFERVTARTGQALKGFGLVS